MRRLLSYVYPITKKVKSEINGTLEITWYNGKKYLDSKNANYSYGSLQKILKLGLEKINFNNYHDILLLGMGGGSVIDTLLNDFHYKHHITAVEIDPVIINIAEEEFGIVKSESLTIICDDAFNFVQKNKKQYDLVILDVFIDINVPDIFLSNVFWKNVVRSTKTSILFNASLNLADDDKITAIISFLKSHQYHVEKLNKVNDTNTLIIAYSNN